ncbi:MAG: metallophosphoesterase [Polyangiaceae bacterium]|jgi:predicted MPP superfamily phosphohydrolase
MSISRLLLAVSILSGVSWLVHRYVWARLVRDAGWPAPWPLVLTVALVCLAVNVSFALVGARTIPRALNAPLAWVAFVWMGFLLYLFLLSALGDLVHRIVALVGWAPDPERRAFVLQLTAVVVASGAALIGVLGLANVARGFRVLRVRIPLAKLPKGASGYVIVQISDVHVGPTIGRTFVERIVRETNAIRPDLVVITGDLVDGSVGELGLLVAPLRDLQAPDGVFFVTGNHEYYSGADEWIAHLRTLGVRVLRNERVDIRGLFDLAGVDDASAHRMLAHHGQDVALALAGRDPSKPVVLLAHQPKALPHALAGRVDLQLSGHVHGGQLVPFNWLARLDQPLIAGLYRIEETWAYVSSGTGYWGPPMRIGSGAELTRLELVSEAQGIASETRSTT